MLGKNKSKGVVYSRIVTETNISDDIVWLYDNINHVIRSYETLMLLDNLRYTNSGLRGEINDNMTGFLYKNLLLLFNGVDDYDYKYVTILRYKISICTLSNKSANIKCELRLGYKNNKFHVILLLFYPSNADINEYQLKFNSTYMTCIDLQEKAYRISHDMPMLCAEYVLRCWGRGNGEAVLSALPEIFSTSINYLFLNYDLLKDLYNIQIVR